MINEATSTMHILVTMKSWSRSNSEEEETGLENEEAQTLDLMVDFMDEIDVFCAILLHAKAIVVEIR
ncbi:hypothetical protein VNO78_03412 [Psophocarpus tetragonolobus]|uniref:Uncharacterized protein n=1 Tax=Psophocarpus tetragonolobus TaxID=3891 RepID=A0AAN9T4A3_PSOTE